MRTDAYTMRMARVSISVPDDVVTAAKAAKINISRLATEALADELERLAKVAELDAYLSELEGQLGPIPETDLAEAERWADRVLGPDHPGSSAEDDRLSA